MQNFDAKYQDGLILAEIDGADWIIDTGAPVSFSDLETFMLDGVTCAAAKSYAGMGIQQVCENLAIKADGILGMDNLSKFDVVFDMPNGQVGFSRDTLEPASRKIEIEAILGVPILFVHLNDIEYRLLLDSGAEIGYLFEDTVSGLRPAGLFTDMLPMYGMFETTTYALGTAISGIELGVLTYGVLPSQLAAMIEMVNVDGIIGNAALRSTRIVLSLRRSGCWIG